MSRILVAAALTAALLATTARAAERDTQTASVSLRGINLGTTSGAAVLQARLRAAARQVCGAADTRDLQAMADMNACRQAAMANAAPQLLAALAGARDNQIAAR